MPSPCDIMMWICSYGAKHCATALLERKTGLIVDLNMPMKSGFYPLHHAAKSLSPNLTDLFLRCGACTDLYCSNLGSKHNEMLPLSVALEAILCHQYLSDWDPTKSIFVLIYILCMPEMKGPLETLELLAGNTEDLKLISTFKAREGKLMELAALLCVAWKKLLVPVTDEGVDSSIIGRCIMEQLSSLISLECRLVNTGHDEELSKCRKMKDVMLSASLMLHVFYRAGDVIYKCRQKFFIYDAEFNFRLVRELICLFKELGFGLKREDTKIDDVNW